MADIFEKLADTFYDYTKKYDKNIINLVREKNIEISLEELREILDDAKKRLQ